MEEAGLVDETEEGNWSLERKRKLLMVGKEHRREELI